MKKVAIMGHGTVGSGVYEVFAMNAARIAQAVGEEVEVKYGSTCVTSPIWTMPINSFPTLRPF